MTEVKRFKEGSTLVPQDHHLRATRFWLGIVMAGLILSGITAFPLETELHFFLILLQSAPLRPFAELTHLLPWISRVYNALASTNRDFPFLAYGTDWLAFAHLVIAVAFIGPYRDPVRNKWVITFGLIASAGFIPLALIAGQVRGIPSFGDLLTAVSEYSEGSRLYCADDTSLKLNAPRKASAHYI
jgi:hypothetical protein